MAKSRLTGICGLFLLVVGVAMPPSASAERQPYDRYQSIVDRQMFGPLPVGFDPSKSPSEVSRSGSAAAEKELTKEQEKVKSAIRFSVINLTPSGETVVGFTDNEDPKQPMHYYLKVGESRNGWEVKEADAASATMTVAKNGVEVSLSLGGDSSKGGAKSAGGQGADEAASGRRSPLLNTLGGRRRMRREREEADQRAAAERAAEAKAAAEERERREEEERAQRAAEREESRRQMQQLQEELRRVREERQSRENDKEEKSAEADE